MPLVVTGVADPGHAALPTDRSGLTEPGYSPTAATRGLKNPRGHVVKK